MCFIISSLNGELIEGIYDIHFDPLKLLCLNLKNKDIIKINDFSQENEYIINTTLIENIMKIEDQREGKHLFYQNDNIILFLL